MSWQTMFKEEVTSASFSLNLSSRMIQALGMCKAYSVSNDPIAKMMGEKFSHFVPAVKSLSRRGLVVHHDRPAVPEGLAFWEQAKIAREHVWYTLTPAGELVYQMCVLADLLPAISEDTRMVA